MLGPAAACWARVVHFGPLSDCTGLVGDTMDGEGGKPQLKWANMACEGGGVGRPPAGEEAMRRCRWRLVTTCRVLISPNVRITLSHLSLFQGILVDSPIHRIVIFAVASSPLTHHLEQNGPK